MHETLSDFDKVWASTLIHRAAIGDFDDLARLYGIPRPSNFPYSDWVNAVWELALGPRGTRVGTFRFVEAGLRRFRDERLVNIDPAQPLRLTPPSGSFAQSYVNRLVRVPDVVNGGAARLYWTTARASLGAYLELAPVATAWWEKPDFDQLPDAVEEVLVWFLPFRQREATAGPVLSPYSPDIDTGEYYEGHGATEILLAPGTVSKPPWNYIQENAEARPDGQPFGGHLCANAQQPGNLVSGKRPFYVGRGRRLAAFQRVLQDLHALGNHIEVKQRDEIY